MDNKKEEKKENKEELVRKLAKMGLPASEISDIVKLTIEEINIILFG